MSIEYVDDIRKNIFSGRFSSTYSPYNARYEYWKYNVFKSFGSFWYLRGELVSSLKSFKVPKGWMGGIPAGVMDSGNVSWLGKGDRGRPVPIAEYARWMEYGRKGQPARPLFRPTLIEYADTRAMVHLDNAKSLLIGAWR